MKKVKRKQRGKEENPKKGTKSKGQEEKKETKSKGQEEKKETKSKEQKEEKKIKGEKKKKGKLTFQLQELKGVTDENMDAIIPAGKYVVADWTCIFLDGEDESEDFDTWMENDENRKLYNKIDKYRTDIIDLAYLDDREGAFILIDDKPLVTHTVNLDGTYKGKYYSPGNATEHIKFSVDGGVIGVMHWDIFKLINPNRSEDQLRKKAEEFGTYLSFTAPFNFIYKNGTFTIGNDKKYIVIDTQEEVDEDENLEECNDRDTCDLESASEEEDFDIESDGE